VPYLILSDIHANLEALQAVLAQARGSYDRILCLGDLVGYGADPNAIAEWARQNVTAAIRGNHDRAGAGLDDMESFNPAARAAASWTQNVLTAQNRAYLENLPCGPMRYEELDLVHGSPLDEDVYLMTREDVAALRPALKTQLTFFGHTHWQGGFLLARQGTKEIAGEGVLSLEPDYLYLVNPGSVGQPRDGDPRAAYALYWPVERTVEFRRVIYDVDRAAAKIRAAGLPDFLAARLYEGT
jgi:diadenosine tetraphosphatase ApaH/serine/threonine PP2A family protein phosphatase